MYNSILDYTEIMKIFVLSGATAKLANVSDKLSIMLKQQ